MSNIKFHMEADNEHTPIPHKNIVFKLTIKNLVMV